MTTLHVVPELYAHNPVVSGEIFADHPEAAFWIGIVASAGTVEKPELYDAEARLRASVYIDQKGFLGPDSADTFGREQDAFDDQSIHLVAVENTKDGTAEVMGSSRIILKRDASDSLPIETDFAEIFDTIPSDIPAVEISRFISQHNNQITQHLVAVSLIRAMTYQILRNEIDTAHFEIEAPLLRLLKGIGLPLESMGKAKRVAEPGGIRRLHPLKVSVSKIPDSVTQGVDGQFSLRDFFKSEEGNGGLGYFPDTLVGGVDE